MAAVPGSPGRTTIGSGVEPGPVLRAATTAGAIVRPSGRARFFGTERMPLSTATGGVPVSTG